MSEPSIQDTTNIPQMSISMGFRADPLTRSARTAAAVCALDFETPLSAAMLLWAAWKAGFSECIYDLFETWSQQGFFGEAAEPFGLMLLDNEWRKDCDWEIELLDHLHRAQPIRSLFLAMAKMGSVAALPTNPTACAGLRKVAQLVDELVAVVTPGHAHAIHTACEEFARHRGQWLKVAGLQKAQLLEGAMALRRFRDTEITLEFGAYVGYTAVRLASRARKLVERQQRGTSGVGTVSLEVNPVHAVVSRHLLDLGHLSTSGEVKTGQARDILALLAEEHGARSIGFSFMDHRGTIFHRDLTACEKHCLLVPKMRIVADNTLNPGAPLLLWQRFVIPPPGSRRPAIITASALFSLDEFLADHEDWMAVVASP